MRARATIISLLISSILLCFFSSSAQEGISLNTPDSYDGYTLIQENSKVYLIDNCGGLINTWTANNGFHLPKLLPNGNILYYVNDGIIEKNWFNNVVNEVYHGDPFLTLRYEVVLLPNGNYLSVGRRRFGINSFNEIGYNLTGVTPTQVDVVVELDRNTGEIVWEWNIADHVIQQRDNNLPNFGVLSENPQLLNMDAVSKQDWLHTESFMINGMDYNPALDQIVLSVRKISEIIIIDHSTTTEEAAGHTGGTSGKGGDILYRWGNPQNYNMGSFEERVLYFQHNPNWITEGALAGQIICYNNGFARPNYDYSTVPIIQPPMDADGNYILEDGYPYMPITAPLEYSQIHTNTIFYSAYTSGAQYLPNGNIFITVGGSEQILEVNAEGEKVWEYFIPFANSTFRTKRYSRDYSAFEGQDLTPYGLLPFDDSTFECEIFQLTSTQSLASESYAFEVTFNGLENILNIKNTMGNNFDIGIFSLAGQSVMHHKASVQSELALGDLPKGMYVLSLIDRNTNEGVSQKIVIQ